METLYDRLGGHDGIVGLIRSFYADARQHGVLGPIFRDKIKDWPEHLEKIVGFWTRQTGGPSGYAGGFGSAHLALGLMPEHFTYWLALWDFNCRRSLGESEAVEMSALAHRIGGHLMRAIAVAPIKSPHG